MIVHTESGSIYEIDLARKLIRSKTPPTTSRLSQDWTTYAGIYPEVPEVGSAILVLWNNEGQCTRTSLVVQAVDTEQN